MTIKILSFALAFSILILVIELVREEKLTFKYAFSWIIVSLIAIIFTIFDNLLFKLAKFFGFELASNFIFFSLLAIFVFLSLLITVFLCQQNNRSDKMAQKISILELELDELKKK